MCTITCITCSRHDHAFGGQLSYCSWDIVISVTCLALIMPCNQLKHVTTCWHSCCSCNCKDGACHELELLASQQGPALGQLAPSPAPVQLGWVGLLSGAVLSSQAKNEWSWSTMEVARIQVLPLLMCANWETTCPATHAPNSSLEEPAQTRLCCTHRNCIQRSCDKVISQVAMHIPIL